MSRTKPSQPEMAFTLPTFPLEALTTKPVITPFPRNPKTVILEQCKTTRDLNQLHAHLIKTRLLHHPSVAEPLLESATLIVPDATIEYAVSIFQSLENADSSAYNVMIRGYNKKEVPEKAILLFKQMIEHSVEPNEFTFASVLRACSKLRASRESAQIHAQVVKSQNGFGSKEFVENALVNLYAGFGRIESARQVFDRMSKRTTLTWNSMFSGYVRSGYSQEVTEFFKKMLEMDVGFDEVTLINVLTACGRVGDLELGEWICNHVGTNGLTKNANLVTSLIDMYAKCGLVDSARGLFDNLCRKDVVAWSAMISGYTQAERCKEALTLFHDMQKANVEPNEVTMVSVLSSSAMLGALETGKRAHFYIKKNDLKLTVTLGTALVDFYAKCGCMDDAIDVFSIMPSRNVWTWTALIHGLANDGKGERALESYNSMLKENVKPNDVTFIAVLCACSHAGLVDNGRALFASMSQDYGIKPKIEHYGCVVDMLGRAGLVNEAYEFINNMPIKPNAVIWRTLLASCRVHKNVDIGEEALKNAVRLEPANSGDYILLSNLYASVGRLSNATSLRNKMKLFGIKKDGPGYSYIELDGVIHELLAEDKQHRQLNEIYRATEEMIKCIKAAGYVANITEARLDAEGCDKEVTISHHSEKLAIAYGLVRTYPGALIRVSKNMRICIDCHNATKIVSKVYGREIIIRDRNRFHHFKDGLCSCNDFW